MLKGSFQWWVEIVSQCNENNYVKFSTSKQTDSSVHGRNLDFLSRVGSEKPQEIELLHVSFLDDSKCEASLFPVCYCWVSESVRSGECFYEHMKRGVEILM